MANEHFPQETFDPDEVFTDFMWRDDRRPDALQLNRAGFFEDQAGAWYLVRRAHTTLPLAEVMPRDLYSGKKVNYHNATQGAGLYFTNTVEAATNVTYAARSARQPRSLYVATVKPDAERLLDVTNPLDDVKVREQAAAQVLRAMAVMPGMPWPTPKMYDFMYDTNTLVISKPSAMQRYRPGMRMNIGSTTIKPRYAIVRDLGIVTLNGYKPA